MITEAMVEAAATAFGDYMRERAGELSDGDERLLGAVRAALEAVERVAWRPIDTVEAACRAFCGDHRAKGGELTFHWDELGEDNRAGTRVGMRAALEAAEAAAWQDISTAPKDGSAFLGFGIHTHSPPDAQRGVVAGDYWWAIILWDVWRDPHQFVFSKDGKPTWSAPTNWRPLPAPPLNDAPSSRGGET